MYVDGRILCGIEPRKPETNGRSNEDENNFLARLSASPLSMPFKAAFG